MGLVFRQDFSKGPSAVFVPLYTSANGYVHGAYAGNDPLYPHIVENEADKVVLSVGPNGENVMDGDTSGGSEYLDAGPHISHQRLSLNKFTIVTPYKLSATAVSEGLPFAPLFHLNSRFLANGELTLAAYIDGSDIHMEVDYKLSSTSGSFRQEYSRPTSSVPTDRFETFKLKGRNGTWNGSGRDADGYLQAFIDGTMIYDIQGIDLDAFQNADRQAAVVTDIGIGFNGLYGQIAYLEIYDDDGDTINADKGNSPCCSTSGAPGGGSTSPDGTINPVGPRQNTTHGVMGYQAFTGGGVLPAQVDSTDPQNLNTATDPIVHIELITADAATQRWGTDAINAGVTSPPIVRKVTSYDSIPTETLADRNGVIPTPGWSVTVDDKDRTVRGWAQGPNRFLLNRFAQLLVEEHGQRKLDTAARKLTAGYLDSWRYSAGDMLVELGFADLLSNGRSPLSLTQKVPKRTFTKILFPGAPIDTLGRPVPWIFGEQSDDYDWSLDNTRLPVGLIPGIYVGPTSSMTIENQIASLGMDWFVFVHAGHAMAKYTSLFAVTGSGLPSDPNGRQRFSVTDGNGFTDVLNPECSAWSTFFTGKYLRIRGTDGSLEDFGATLLRGPKASYSIDGTQPYSVNCWGLEDVGDGTGLCVDSPAHQVAFFICFAILSDYRYGTWASNGLPLYPGGTPKFNRTSVDTVKAIHDLRLSGAGYQTSWTVGTAGANQDTAQNLLTNLQIGGGLQLGLNHFGALYMDTFNPNANVSALRTFDDSSIDNFEATAEPDLFANVQSFDYGPEPSTGRVTGELQTLIDTVSITNNGERREAEQWTNVMARRKDVALDVGGLRLAYSANVPIQGTFQTDQRGLTVSGGQLLRLTSEYGLGSAGWTDRIVRVTGVNELPNDDELRVEIAWEDVHDLLAVNATAAAIFPVGGLSRGLYWGQPIGDTGAGSAMPLGDTTTGSARPLL